MAIRTFNLDEKIHKDYADYCKREGISMSKKIENFIKSELEALKSKAIKKTIAKEHTQNSSNKTPQTQSPVQDPNSFSKYCY